jgi:hypothetical protein
VNTTVYVNAGANTLAEYVNGSLSLNYLMGAGVGDYVALVKSGAVHWYSRNQLGAIVAITDSAKAIKERYR